MIFRHIKNIVIYTIKTILLYAKNHKCRYMFYAYTGFMPPPGCIFNKLGNIKIGSSFALGYNCKIYAQDGDNVSKVSIGDNVSLNDNVMINADNGGKIIIGNNTIIGPNSIFRASNHKFDSTSLPFKQQGHKPGVIRIGNNVWIGANVLILPDVTIGDNVVIGGGSIVTKDIGPSSLALGSPAKVIRKINH